MEIDLTQRKIHGMGDAELSPGDHVESQSFFFEYKSQRPVQEGFAGIDDDGIRITFTELVIKFSALLAESEFIEKIERCTELLSQIHNIATADKDVTLLVYLRGEWEQS
jgi:hypothetical protein